MRPKAQLTMKLPSSDGCLCVEMNIKTAEMLKIKQIISGSTDFRSLRLSLLFMRLDRHRDSLRSILRYAAKRFLFFINIPPPPPPWGIFA